MSSTISVGKMVGALKSTAGHTVFALFEKTYESNVFPKTPSWCCIYLGRIEGAMERIFWAASACEGGMLKGAGGWISPEGYITQWMSALASPRDISHWTTVRLERGSNFMSSVNAENLSAVQATMNSHGRQVLATELMEQGEANISVKDDVELIEALISVGVSAWRLVPHTCLPEYQEVREDLSYRPVKSKGFSVTTARCLKINDDMRLLQRDDGSWFYGGWAYSIIGSFIRGLWKSELKEPGSFKERIKAYRTAISKAEMIPDVGKVVVDVQVEVEQKWQRTCLDKMPGKYPALQAGFSYEFDLALMKTHDRFLDDVSQLPAVATKWYFSDEPVVVTEAYQELLAL